MEKYRAVLEVVKKYHFWILCGLIVVLAFGSWFKASSDEDNDFKKRKSVIDSEFTTVERIKTTQNHPTEKSNQEIIKLTNGELTDQVSKASYRLYKEMREANPLPQLYQVKGEQKAFEDDFERIWRPMEDIEKLTPREELQRLYRIGYQSHIGNHFPELQKLVELRTFEDRVPGVKPSGVVDWYDAEEKKSRVVEGLPAVPSTVQVAKAQEDLWIYETLLKVVRYTNNIGRDREHYQKPPDHKSARIKQILAMDIGSDAVACWGKCENKLFTLADSGGVTAAKSDNAATTSGTSQLADRYVDDVGKPIADPNQQPYPEFRMMPINLKLVIEQREIPRLLAECANSAMRIDVRRVRILVDEPPPVDFAAENPSATVDSAPAAAAPAAGAATDTPGATQQPAPPPRRRGRRNSGGSAGAFDFGGGSRSLESRMGLGQGQVFQGALETGEAASTEEASDPVYPPVTVELQGIVYIYNPPRVQNPSATAGNTGGQTPPATPDAGSPTTGASANGTPTTGATAAGPAKAAAPAPAATPTNPATSTPTSGGHP